MCRTGCVQLVESTCTESKSYAEFFCKISSGIDIPVSCVRCNGHKSVRTGLSLDDLDIVACSSNNIGVDSNNVRLVNSGFLTWLIRHEINALLILLVVWTATVIWSIHRMSTTDRS